MGTHSITRVFDEDGIEILCLFGHWDGYPYTHGVQVAEFLRSKKLVNSVPIKEYYLTFSSMGDLAAQLIVYLKLTYELHCAVISPKLQLYFQKTYNDIRDTETGNFCIYPVGTKDVWEEYEYIIKPKNGAIELEVYDIHFPEDYDVFESPADQTKRGRVLIFSGSPEEFLKKDWDEFMKKEWSGEAK